MIPQNGQRIVSPAVVVPAHELLMLLRTGPLAIGQANFWLATTHCPDAACLAESYKTAHRRPSTLPSYSRRRGPYWPRMGCQLDCKESLVILSGAELRRRFE